MADFPSQFDPTSSVLFLGAGFSAEATNVLGVNLPAGRGLEEELKRRAGLPMEDPAELQDLPAYAVEAGVNIHNLLSDLYTVKKLSGDQSIILAQPWMRIYTTNYDDIPYVFYNEGRKGRRPEIYSLEDAAPKHLRSGSVVHLHGYIHRCTRENVLNQLVLTHHSYAQQRAIESPWWDFFERDLRICENAFFVGYELRDLEPAKCLTKNPATTGKTHFVLRPTKSPVAERRLQGYGARHSIALGGFAQECQQTIIRGRPAHANALHAFRYVDITQDDRAPVLPSPAEVQSLYSFGKFQFSRLLATFPIAAYVLPRSSKLDQSLEEIEQNKTIILHSKIGNGKTTFWHVLSLALTQRGHTCFELKEGVSAPESDIDYIRETEKPVIFFPSFDSAYSNMYLFSDMPKTARFIVEMNTSTIEVRRQEVFNLLPDTVSRIDLNILSKEDCRTLFRVLDDAGIAPPYFREKFGRGDVEFRDILLSVFEHPLVAQKIDDVVRPLLSNSNAKLIFFYTAILKALDSNVDSSFIRAIAHIDAYQVLTETGETAHEFVDFSQDRVEPHSSVFSEYMLKRYLEGHELIGAVFRIASEAARRLNEDVSLQSDRFRSARATLSGIMRYGFLGDLLNRHPDREVHIKKLYESCRRDVYIKKEPLFWLQYSIFMQDLGEWQLAERHMETAYDRGSDRPSFRTFQLDTNYLGLCLKLEAEAETGKAVARLEKIMGLLEVCRGMISEGNHRGHVLKVLSRVEGMARVRRADLTRAEANGLVYELNLIVDRLSVLPDEEKASWGSEPVRESLSRAVYLLAMDQS